MTDHALTHLPVAAARLGQMVARPKAIAAACVVALTAVGWLALALLSEQSGTVFGSLCRPADQPMGVLVTGAMWSAMTLAMMLPSAAPMILTYAEIADTAAGKGEKIISPFTIAAGYVLVWLAFALAATFLQTGAAHVPLSERTRAYLSGAIFIGAGAYQFSVLKHACLSRCRHPFQFFFAHWQTTARGVFRLGMKQGLYCLGCCWAMMALMFVTGVMNVVWMAALAVFMTIEKMTVSKAISHAAGMVLIVIGIVLMQ